MFPTSVGRRLILIVLSLTMLFVGLLVYIAIDTSTDALRITTEENFADQNRTLINSVVQQVDRIEQQAQLLTDTVASRSRWTPGELRRHVLDFIGSGGVNSSVAGVHILTENSDQVITFDYTELEDPPPGIILPVNRGVAVEAIPDEAWINESIELERPHWRGPGPVLFGAYDEAVLSYVIPLEGSRSVVWVDVPLGVFEQVMQNLLDIETTGSDEQRGYTVLINSDNEQLVIASVDAPTARTLPGEPLRQLAPLPEIGIPTQMQDPLIEGEESYALQNVIPGTGWRLVTVTPNRVLERALPLASVMRLVLVTVFGLFFLAFVVQRFINATVTDPLNRLSLAAQEIGAGDLRYQIGYRQREDEIGRLSRALEDMKSNLARSYNELEDWSNNLEKRVRARTRELDIARREAQASAGELRAVYDESLLVVSAYQLQTILQTLTQRIYTLLEASYTAVWLVSDDGEQLRLVATTTSDKSRIGTTIPRDVGLVGRAIMQEQLLVVDDYPNWSGRLDIETSQDMHQSMAVPLVFSGEAIGAVVVGRTYDAPFFEVNDQRLLQLFANLVSPAVRNAQLFVQRDRAVEEAERANQVKTRFLASVTHELRTPLNLVINNMDFMRIGAFGEVNQEQVERLDQTIRSAEHLLYLINDLLDVSKIEAGEMQLFIQETDLYTILDDAIANTEVLIEQYNKADLVEFHNEIDADIPPFPLDARRARQILVNLLGNAVKFTEQGRVTLKVSNRKHYVRVDVADTGMGIPEDELDKLFEAFERTNSAKEKAIEGTGLGLPICKFLVEAHGGELTVKSEMGEGTVFTFTLPLKQRQANQSDTQSMNTILNKVRKDVAQE
jgi:signal transduction histidine kinase/HAMP domain-containing protein